MVKEKEYYWIKLQEHFFEDDKIIYLLSQENGAKYVIFWIKLLLKCLKNKDSENREYGFLRFTDKIPYDENLLAKVLNTDIDTVRVALEYFLQLEMIEILDDKTIYIEEVNKMIGQKQSSTDRVRKHRERKKLLLNETDVTKCNVTETVYKELEKEEEKENKDRDRDNKPDDSIESLSFFCPYCFEENKIKNESYINLCCMKCGRLMSNKRLTIRDLIDFCTSMNKNYKYYTLSELLYKEHLKSDDKFLAGKDLINTFLRWANDIRLLCETDKRDRELVKDVIIWCQQHEGSNGFSWKNNILSGKKLREKFPVLYGQYMQQTKKSCKINKYRESAIRIIKHLNSRLFFDKSNFSNYTMSNFPTYNSYCDAILKYPVAILQRGKTEADCKRVIDVMASHWKFDPKMREFLRPSTLFNPEKFDGYLNKPKKPKWETLDDGATWQWEEE